MTLALAGAQIFDGESLHSDLAVVLDDDQIIDVVPDFELGPEVEIHRLNGGTLAPGFIDLQVNGGGGVLLNNQPTAAAVNTMVAAHRALGTTSMLPTLISDTPELQHKAVKAVTKAIENGAKGILGVHIEGPFFHPDKRGAHKADCIRQPTQQDLDWLIQLAPLKVMLTLAPERCHPGDIRRLTEAGIAVCAGHTNATYAQTKQAITEGLRGFTHLFNAMSPLQSRDPGVVGAALSDRETWCGIIVDGHHVHDATVLIAHHTKAAGKLYLVSDAMATVGGPDKQFELYGEVIREHNGSLINEEGRLAGSAISMMDAVKHCANHIGLPLQECLRMASLYPAQMMQVDNLLGRLKPDYRADLVHFNSRFEVQNTWVAGQHQQH